MRDATGPRGTALRALAARQRVAAVRGTRLLLACGAIGPVVFWALGGAVAATWPGYDLVADSISSLVHAPFGWLQVLAFAVGALLTLAWAVGAGRVIGGSARDRTVVRTVFAVQAAIALAFALLPTDAAEAPLTVVGALHLLTFCVYAVATPISLAAAARVFGRDPAWRRAARPTATAAGIMVAATLLVPVTIGGPLKAWLGLLERIYVAIPGAWQALVALRAFRLVARRSGTPAPAGGPHA